MDQALLWGIQHYLANPFFDAVLPVFTYAGEAGAIWVVACIAMLASKRYRPWGFALLATLLAVLLVGELALKNIVARPRPFVTDPSYQLLLPPPAGYSFPSGHTSAAIGSAIVISASPLKLPFKVAAWVVAVMLAFSRLYLYVHNPTDVLAGALLGTLCALAALAILRRLQERA